MALLKSRENDVLLQMEKIKKQLGRPGEPKPGQNETDPDEETST